MLESDLLPDLFLYRGLDLKYRDNKIFEKNEIISDPAFTSTTVKRKIAEGTFGYIEEGKVVSILIIYNNDNQKGLPIGNGEAEVILPRDTFFKIMDTKLHEGRYYSLAYRCIDPLCSNAYIPSNIPDLFLKQTSKYKDGPNCFNTSLNTLNITDSVRYVHTSEMNDVLKNQCQLLDIQPEVEPSIVVIKKRTGILYNPLQTVHSFAYFPERDLSVSKNNWRTEEPIYSKSMEEELVKWKVKKSCFLYNEMIQEESGKLVNKEDLNGCDQFIQFYKCSRGVTFDRQDIKKINEKQKQLEKDIEGCLPRKNLCNLAKLNQMSSNINHEVTSLRQSIEKEKDYRLNPDYSQIRTLEIKQESLSSQVELLSGRMPI